MGSYFGLNRRIFHLHSRSIDLHVQSIARFIPNDEDDESQYIGISKVSKKGLSATQGRSDAELRAKQAEAQRNDAGTRKLAWSVEDSRWTDEDAEGENDPDYANDSGIALACPLGLRQADGSIAPEKHEKVNAMDIESPAEFYGKPDIIPSRVGELVSRS